MPIGPDTHSDFYAFIDGKDSSPSFEAAHPREISEIAREDHFRSNKVAGATIAAARHEVLNFEVQPKTEVGRHAGEYSFLNDHISQTPSQGRRVLKDQ